ncbi:hypothetical protein L345_09283, partial [Ophiophagus hannah]
MVFFSPKFARSPPAPIIYHRHATSSLKERRGKFPPALRGDVSYLRLLLAGESTCFGISGSPILVGDGGKNGGAPEAFLPAARSFKPAGGSHFILVSLLISSPFFVCASNSFPASSQTNSVQFPTSAFISWECICSGVPVGPPSRFGCSEGSDVDVTLFSW